MADDSQQPIIVKRIKKGGAAAHGGAWKIAYADFVTAMMAFFLLMWLLGSTSQGDLKGISDFFTNPMKVAMSGGSGAGDATSIIKGGGQDLSRQAGQVKRGDIEGNKQTTASKAAKAEFERQEKANLMELKNKIEQMVEMSVSLRPYKNQLHLDVTSEGLRIQIVDEQNRPMFDTSSAEMKPYAREIMREIGKMLNGVSNRVSVSGHTDAAQYAGGAKGFSNWELSANRANSARRELISGGMDEFKVLRVVGLASTILFDQNDPLNPVNRRISIIVMNKKAEMALLNPDNPELQVETGEGVDAEKLVQQAAPQPAGGPPVGIKH